MVGFAPLREGCLPKTLEPAPTGRQWPVTPPPPLASPGCAHTYSLHDRSAPPHPRHPVRPPDPPPAARTRPKGTPRPFLLSAPSLGERPMYDAVRAHVQARQPYTPRMQAQDTAAIHSAPVAPPYSFDGRGIHLVAQDLAATLDRYLTRSRGPTTPAAPPGNCCAWSCRPFSTRTLGGTPAATAGGCPPRRPSGPPKPSLPGNLSRRCAAGTPCRPRTNSGSRRPSRV